MSRMIAAIQRVREASVTTPDRTERIDRGIVVLLGVASDDSEVEVEILARKTAELRIFEDSDGKMNLSLLDISGSALIVSQFTLLADCKKGRRPSFTDAADPKKGRMLYGKFVDEFRRRGIVTSTGEFGAHMEVELINDGPVTIILNSRDLVRGT